MSLIHNMRKHRRDAVQLLAMLGYCAKPTLDSGDAFPLESNGRKHSDYTRAGNACLNHALTFAVARELLGLSSEYDEVLLYMKPHKAEEQKLVVEYGMEGYALYRTWVESILTVYGLGHREVKVAVSTGHTAASNIKTELDQPKPNRHVLLAFWVSQRVSGSGGLTDADTRWGDLQRTWGGRAELTELQTAWELAAQVGQKLLEGSRYANEEDFIIEVNRILTERYYELATPP